MAEKSTKETLAVRLLRVLDEVEALPKLSKGQHGAALGKFQVSSMIRPLLVKHGVLLVADYAPVDSRVIDVYSSEHPGQIIGHRFYESVLLTATFINCSDPEDQITATGPGASVDSSDFAYGLACGYALKSLLLTMFLLEVTPGSDGGGKGGGRNKKALPRNRAEAFLWRPSFRGVQDKKYRAREDQLAKYIGPLSERYSWPQVDALCKQLCNALPREISFQDLPGFAAALSHTEFKDWDPAS